MALATRCPACSTVFRISTAQATAKGGTVRCGQCRHVFNSLDALVRVEDLEVIEEVQVASRAGSDGDAPQPVLQPAAPTADESPDSVGEPLVGSAVEPSADAVESPDAGDGGTTDPDREPVSTRWPSDATPLEAELDGRPTTEATDPRPDTSDDRPPRAWWLPDPADGLPTAPAVSSSLRSGPSTDPRDDAGRLLSGRRTDLQATGTPLDAGAAFLVDGAPSTGLGRTALWTLGVLSAFAAIALLAQLAYLWRDEIAVRWPQTRPWLAAACGPLRCTVGYPAHLDWITIESATIQTTGAGLDVYVLNALLRNRAASDVRYPYLELVLTDLQDRPILRRALRPEDYLPAARRSGDAASQAGFAADSELPIHLTFELGDLRFAGYRVDKFYP